MLAAQQSGDPSLNPGRGFYPKISKISDKWAIQTIHYLFMARNHGNVGTYTYCQALLATIKTMLD